MKEEKAAILLMSLGSEAAEEVLARLGPDRSSRLRAQMERLGQAEQSQELINQVVREFETLIETGNAPPVGFPRIGPTREPAQAATAANAAAAPAAVMDNRRVAAAYSQGAAPSKAEPEATDDAEDPLATLSRLTVDRLAAALTGEHPRTVCLILNALEAERAGEVLKRLPPEARRDVSLRLGQTLASGGEVLRRIARAVLHKSRLDAQAATPANEDAKYKKIADMLRLLDKKERMDILTAFDQQDPQTAAKVKELLYQFEDLLLIEDRSMQKLLTEIDTKSLAVALKNSPDAIKDKVLNNLSKRAREPRGEEIDFLGSIPAAQGQQAQKAVVDVIQRLDQAGELVMAE